MEVCRVLRKIILLLAVVSLISACAAQHPRHDRFEFSVNVDDAINIPVEVFIPASGVPRAIIFVLPGTDGMSDPYLFASLLQPDYRPDKLSAMTDVLLRSNYAVAYYGQRGLAPTKSCVVGTKYDERLKSYSDKCIDIPTRSGVSLDTITADTQKVLSALAVHPRLAKLPHVVLAISEGLYHIGQLVQKKSTQPIGIVAIGGPLEALSVGAQYQAEYKYYFDLLATAFSRCGEKSLKIDRLFACANVCLTPEKAGALAQMFKGELISLEDVPARRLYFENQTQNFTKSLADLPSNSTTTLAAGSYVMNAWSIWYGREIIKATQPVGEKLGGFNGRIVLLYGAEDHRTYVRDPRMCGASGHAQNSRFHCDVVVLPGLGHGLEDESGFPPASAWQVVVDSINLVSQTQ